MQGFHELVTPADAAEAAALLRASGLSFPLGADYGLGLYEDGRIRAAGFLAGNLLCGLAVDPGRRGEGLASAMVGKLMEHGRAEGRTHFLLITKAEEAEKFSAVGFTRLAGTDRAAFLEFGRPGYADWAASARKRLAEAAPAVHGVSRAAPHAEARSAGEAPGLASVVMNANPFTLGHRCLVEAAVRGTGRTVVFVVEEDASVFPFAARLDLVRRGLADLGMVTVLPGGPYMVSRASFPSYFTGEREHAAVHAALDAALFAERIGPDLGVTARYIGTEPLCAVTAAYNRALRETLPPRGIACVEVRRLERDGVPVSASQVRERLKRAVAGPGGMPDWRAVADLVPKTTLSYLRSPAAAPALERLAGRSGAPRLP